MNTSTIECTNKTWNPVVGCTKISSGCANCYAEVMAKRLQGMRVKGYEKGFKLTLLSERLKQPLEETKPRMIFVNSMSDLFHCDVPFEYIDSILDTIKQTPQHTYQVLTKRAPILEDYFQNREVPPNMWVGVTVENQVAKSRIDHLRRVKAGIRFVSFEPLLEDLGRINLEGIHWAIVGGESGARARPMAEQWALNIKEVCEQTDVPFFFKQWGTWGQDNVRRSKKANGDRLQGATWKAFPR